MPGTFKKENRIFRRFVGAACILPSMPRFQGAVRKRGERWTYRLRHAGYERRIGGFSTEEEATLALAADRLRIVKEEALGVKIPDRVTFEGFRSTYKPLLETHRSPAWVATSLGHYDIMAERLGKKALRDIREKDVEDLVTWLVKERKVKPSTTNRYLSTLSSVMRAAMKRNLALSNPVVKGMRGKEEAKAVPWISAEDLARLYASIPEEYRPVCVLASETGMRRGELLALDWRDVSLERGVVLVRKSKSKKPREVPLTSVARGVLSALLAGRAPAPIRGAHPVFPGMSGFGLSKGFPRWAKAATLGKMRFHDLRHSWASRLVRAGVDLGTVMRLGGWASLSMVSRYGLHAPENAGRRAIAAMEAAEAVPVANRKQA